MINGNPAVSAQNPCTSNRVVYLGGIAAAGVFSSLLLISYLIISGNFEEISSPLLFTSYFLAASILLTLLLLVLFWLMPFRIAKLIAVTIAAYALISLTLDAALPLGIGELEDGTESAPAAPIWGSIFQISGTVITGYIIWRMPLILAGSIGWAIAAVIIASTITPYILRPLPNEHKDHFSHSQEGTSLFNIYHVVFDSYYGPWLQWAMDELEIDTTVFPGFIYFPSARSNYWSTHYSYSSFMSGTIYDSEITISEWLYYINNNSLINDLKDINFFTSFTGFRRVPALDSVDQEEILIVSNNISLSDLSLLLDLWLVRAAPVHFRHHLFFSGSGAISKYLSKYMDAPVGESRAYRSYHQFIRTINLENSRPDQGVYLHVHVYPPHPPPQLDRRGEFVGKSSYGEQLLLATNMMTMFTERLKELNRYNDSLIIFQSDHGSPHGGANWLRNHPVREFVTIDDHTARQVKQVNLKGFSGRNLDARFGALLMVKPPSSCQDVSNHHMLIDHSLVQLKDLRKFINTIISDEDNTCKFPVRDYVDIHVGMRFQYDSYGDRKYVGQDLLSGELNVFRIHSDGRWEILPNIEFTY